MINDCYVYYDCDGVLCRASGIEDITTTQVERYSKGEGFTAFPASAIWFSGDQISKAEFKHRVSILVRIK